MNEHFHILSFNLRNLDVKEVGLLHLEDKERAVLLLEIKNSLGLHELMYLSTCNRVEFFFVDQKIPDKKFISNLINRINPNLSQEQTHTFTNSAILLNHETAVEHVLRLTSSLDSMVIGEREIITQVRQAYENCLSYGITGEFLRLLIKQSIQTAKEIFTNTDISKNPISVVSLAYRKLRELNVSDQSRFLVIGAGETNMNMSHYLKKHKFANFAVFNRTIEKAEKLAKELGGKAFSLNSLADYKNGFDVILTCTSSSTPILTKEIYSTLLNGEKTKKIIIDLAVPTDTAEEVIKTEKVKFIGIGSLQELAKQNLVKREKEVERCEKIIQEKWEEFFRLIEERKVELAFNSIPKQVRQIREIAINEVFVKEISALDPSAKELLEKVMVYMEKKYNAVAMKTAKEILIEEKGN